MKNPQKPGSHHGKAAEHEKSRQHRVESRTPSESKPDIGGQKRPDEPTRVHAPERDVK